MTAEDQLFLHEEVMLLALRDEEGTLASGTWYQYAIAGAMVAELLLAERIRLEDPKGKRVRLVDRTSMGEALLDECIERLRTSKKQRGLETWVSRFAGFKQLKHRVAAQLVRRGILRADEETILLFFTRKVYPEIDPEPEEAINARLRRAILRDGREVDARTVVLVALCHHANLLRLVFDKGDLKRRKARIEQVINGDVLGKATKAAIDAVQAAVTTSIIAASVASTVAITSSS